MRVAVRRRLVLLSTLAILGCGALGYTLHVRRTAQVARDERARGMAAFDRGDFAEAVGAFVRSNDREPLDVEARLRYAQAALAVPGADTRHVEAACGALLSCIRERPELEAARRLLLRNLPIVNKRALALEQAEWLLRRDPDDSEAATAKATILSSLHQFDAALDALERTVPADGPSLSDQVLYLDLMARNGVDAEAIGRRATSVVEAHRDHPEYELLRLRANILTSKPDGVAARLQALLPLTSGDDQFALLLAQTMDAAGLRREAVDLYCSLPPARLGSALMSALSRRLVQVGEYERLLTLAAGWRQPAESAPTTVLAYEALALSRTGDSSAASTRLAVLRARTESTEAQGWARLLDGVLLAKRPSPRAVVDACLRSLGVDPENPQTHYELGLAYRQLGELELAVREMRFATELAIDWPDPAVQATRILAESGRMPAALGAATEAVSRGSTDPAVVVLLEILHGHRTARTRSELAAHLARRCAELQMKPEDSAAIRLSLVAADRDADGAKALIRSLLEPTAGAPSDALLAAALLSSTMRLGLEAECLSLFRLRFGNTPSLALAVTEIGADSPEPLQKVQRFREARAAAPDSSTPSWDVAEATLLERLGQPTEASVVWRRIDLSTTTDALLVRAVLEGSAARRDSEFGALATGRLRELTGETALWWRFHEAQQRLAGNPSDGNLSQAVELLKFVVNIAPEFVRARALLAAALERQGEVQQALEHLTAARREMGASVAIDMQVARLQLAVGEVNAAQQTLRRLIAARGRSGTATSAGEDLSLAALFARIGDMGSLLEILNRSDAAGRSRRDTVGAAELYAVAGELGRAEQLVRSVLDGEEGPEALLLAAALAEAQRRPDDAKRLLDELASKVQDRTERESLIADHYLRSGALVEAEQHLQVATKAPDSRRSAWLRLISTQILLGRSEAAVSSLAAFTKRPDSESAGTGRPLSAATVRIAAERPELRALGALYVTSPRTRDVLEAAVAVAARIGAGDFGDGARAELQTIAQLNPRIFPLQVVAIDATIRSGDLKEAIRMATLATENFPIAPEPHRALAHALAASGRTKEALVAAENWRIRSPRTGREAIVFSARILPAQDARELLEPQIPAAITDGDGATLSAYWRILIECGRESRVVDEAAAQLTSNARLVTDWLQFLTSLAASARADLSRKWLDDPRILRHVSLSLAAQVAHARAWSAVATASGLTGDRTHARDVASSLATASGSPEELTTLAMVHSSNGDDALAAVAYRRALELNPGFSVALNNLAMIEARQGRPKEAVRLAARLVESSPETVEFVDTLAFALGRDGATSESVRLLEQNRTREPRNARWARRIVETLIEGRQNASANAALRRFREEYRVDEMRGAARDEWEALGQKLAPDRGTPR